MSHGLVISDLQELAFRLQISQKIHSKGTPEEITLDLLFHCDRERMLALLKKHFPHTLEARNEKRT